MVGLARRRRPSFAPALPSRSRAARRLEAPVYPRGVASRLMFGTPAARRPLLVALYVDLHRSRYRALLKKQIKYHYTNGV
jgi:hypothetical protein